ncbi:Phosphoribosylanthranilate isomerase [Prochlorococcus marinus subsp. marinus str. CCMP1375]|uniref:N-(5'-phosphoribosyl)anthranilate isomerase n=2 Tax=Prochlorococcaceae TaxID=2881426 RepID=Q7VD45_PROMA|nr:Phosphoribosylanthranilate isomerase [Prochlorococcus marinus subsp. marinus str. CCMP1375]
MRAQASIAIKVCGITKPQQAIEIALMGADAIGVIGVKNSPRYISEPERRTLFEEMIRAVPSKERVWVVANLNKDEIIKGLNSKGSPSIVQLHGNESKQYCEDLKRSHPNIQFWKSFQIRQKNDLVTAKGYQASVDAILFDSWHKSSLGGTGQRIPIEWLEDIDFQLPWWLAGGISSDCIQEILSKLKPFGIDASSKLELEPGIKNIKKVEELIKKIRAT